MTASNLLQAPFRVIAVLAISLTLIFAGGGCGGGGAGSSVSKETPTVTLTSDATSVSSGDAVTLTWFSTNADYVASSSFGAAGAAVNSSMTVFPTITTVYTITVAGASGQASASTTVAVQ